MADVTPQEFAGADTPAPGPHAGFDLLLSRDFLDAETRARLLAELRRAPGAAASVYTDTDAGLIDERVRRATRVEPCAETRALVRRALLDRRAEIGAHFSVALRGCEEPQFLRYGEGGFFVAHQDGNTGMMLSERERTRKVSVVVFLNAQSDAPEPGAYGGGSLVFHRWRVGTRGEDRTLSLAGEPGSLLAFPPQTTHEVTPVTHGERYTIACWYV